MADTITKILFRRGLDVIRRTGGGDGVKFNVGEPAYNIDTKRLYVGDGIEEAGTIGGTPAGIKMHGVLPVVINGSSVDSSVYATLTANGIDIGDLLVDNNTSIMHYVSSKNPLSAIPEAFELARVPLIGQVTCSNGISSIKVNSANGIYVNTSLDATYFTVGGSVIQFNQDAQVGSGATPRNLVVYGDLNGNGYLNIGLDATVDGSLTVGTNISAYGTIYTAPFGAAGHNSNDWASGFSTIASTSGTWSSTTTLLNSYLPFPFVYNTGATTVSSYSNVAKFGINAVPNFVGLTVKGADTLTSALSVMGSIVATGDVVVFSTSDINLKKNITPITSALEKVCGLRGVTFDWDCAHRSGRDAGVIAQDVEKVLPEVISIRGDGSKAVNYNGLIPLLVEAIKELNNKLK